MNIRVTEKELIEKATGERVTLADVNSAIVAEYYMTADRAIGPDAPAHSSLQLMTICSLVLWNGWTVIGKSACADPANFNEELGRRLARTDAVNQIWPLAGYELKCRLVNDALLIGSAVVEPQEGFDVYIGTKVINAMPCTRFAYNELRGWELPANEDGDDEGYVVEYTDRIETKPHVQGFEGYISWSPKEVFERAYRPVRAAEAKPAAASAEGTGEASQKEVFKKEYQEALSRKEETWLDRAKVELIALTERYDKLEAYLRTDTFDRLPAIDRKDLYVQVNMMEGYKHALAKRVARADALALVDGKRAAQQQAQQFQNVRFD